MLRTFSAMLTFSALAAVPALACTCVHAPPSETPRQRAERYAGDAEAIFEGKAVDLKLQSKFMDAKIGEAVPADNEDEFPHVRVTLQPTRFYRGVEKKTILLVTGLGGGDCGYIFRLDEEYLVYAYKDESDQLSTSICSGTAPLTSSISDLAYLRGEPEPALGSDSKRASQPVVGQVCGRIAKAKDKTAIVGSVALLEFPRKTALPFSDEPAEIGNGGTFCFKEVEPGTYHLLYREGSEEMVSGFAYYPGVLKESEAEAIEVKAGSKLDIVFNFDEQPTYGVSGRVSMTAGLPLPGPTKVFLVSADQPFLALFYAQDVKPGGSFDISGVLPGKYWVSVEVESDEAPKWFTRKLDVEVDRDIANLELPVFAQ